MVDMEHYAFIHGSSEGQSTIIPPGCPISICNDLANKYFQGRVPRQKQSAAQLSLFIDLFKGSNNEVFCVYSFVNNDCFGSKGRDGQYLAISVLCKGFFAYPEAVHNMLQSAYNQMFATGKVLHKSPDGKDQYVIAQFSEREEYLVPLLEKINSAFSSISQGQQKAIEKTVTEANYDSWDGVKVNLSNANSLSTFSDLCKIGRVYVSDEYDTPSQIIDKLKERIHKLESEKNELEQKITSARHSEKTKAKEELESLTSQLKQSEETISALRKDNEMYQFSMNVVRDELDKYAKASKSITNLREQNEKNNNESNKDLLKTLLLWLILILTILGGILQYCFFRYGSSLFETKVDEVMKHVSSQPLDGQVHGSETHTEAGITPSVSPPRIEAPAAGGEYNVSVISKSFWDVPTSKVSWVRFRRTDNTLLIVLSENSSTVPRDYTFFVLDEQVKITQKGKEAPRQDNTNDYGLVIKDSNGNILKSGSNVYNGQELTGTVNKLPNNEGVGWTYYMCTGNNRGENVGNVSFKISGEAGTTAAIGYGILNDISKRQIIRFKIVERPIEESSSSSATTSGTAGTEASATVEE